MSFEYNQENFYKEIKVMQFCITGMGHNLFMDKGWVLSIVATSMALLPESWFKYK